MRFSVRLLKFTFYSICALLYFSISFLKASHNTSRYFPFLERPAEYIINGQSHISPELFYSKASVAFKRGGGDTGIPELYGIYDLRDLIASLQQVQGANFVNPIEEEKGPNDSWIDKSIRFKVNGKIKARGLILNYEQCLNVHGKNLNFKGLSLGVFVPLMYVNTSDNYAFLPNDSDPQLQNLKQGELDQLSRIRRNVHDELGLLGGDWNRSGLGDLDLHVGLNYNWDHKWLMKSIDLNFRLGTTIPVGVDSDINYPSAASFMGNGSWSIYFDMLPEFELKQDWKIGFIFGAMYQFSNTRRFRMPVYQEPAIFSALFSDLKIQPGMTFKFSPYFIAENLTDGIDFQVRYTYLRHSEDKWFDERMNPDIKSYLNQEPGTEVWTGKVLTQEDIDQNIRNKKSLTKWRMHYLTFELVYDSKEAGNNWVLDPMIYLTFDYQFSGNGSCKTHQLTLGVEAHF